MNTGNNNDLNKRKMKNIIFKIEYLRVECWYYIDYEKVIYFQQITTQIFYYQVIIKIKLKCTLMIIHLRVVSFRYN